MTTPKNIYQLKVSLDDAKPPIWRRLLVPENITLYDLHRILQVAMGWDDAHLHMFTVGGQAFGDPEDDETGDLGIKSESRYRLNQLGLSPKMKFAYEYDFGDSWMHTILVESILPAEKGAQYPRCVAGKRACPPEDVGGIWGYQNFLEVISDPTHEEYDEMREWAGDDFDPEAFDLEEVNDLLRGFKRTGRRGGAPLEVEGMDEDRLPALDEQGEALANAMANWIQNLSEEQVAQLEELPLRRDMLTFLEFLSENRIVGTQSTGNLPIKAVYAICERFVNPPKLDETFDGFTRKIRSEDEVWPLMFVHQLAFHSELVSGGQAKVWRVTAEGEKFSQVLIPVQVFFLFLHWWVEVDWMIAFLPMGIASGIFPDIKTTTLACLRELPVGEKVLYLSFADRLIEQSKLEWQAPDRTFARMILRSIIERLVVDPMVRFGVLECEYELGEFQQRQLEFVSLTRLGAGMLELIQQSGFLKKG